MTESLDDSIRAKFEGVSNEGLIHRMERANDFGYDDEEYELSRRLKLGGQAWRWTQWGDRDRVLIYPKGGQTVANLSEEELIGLMIEPGMREDVLSQAEDEYFRRRGEVFDAAARERQEEGE